MQRLFTMFPTGTAGIALLALRISIAASLVVDGIQHCALFTSCWLVLLFVSPAVFFCIGFLTPYSAGAAFLFQLSLLVTFHGQDMLHLSLSMLNCGVLAVLGPGAYSVDARLFGRRIVSLPRR